MKRSRKDRSSASEPSNGLPEIAQKMIADDVAGKLKRSYVFNGERDGDKWSLAPFRDHEDVLGADNIAKLKDIEKKVRNGTIKVPNQFAIGKRGSSFRARST